MNVFTMSLVCGSWLGDRRETQDQRLFKYAKKGFGLRFLPKQLQQLKDANVDINELAKEGRARFNWLFRRLVRHYGWDKVSWFNFPENKLIIFFSFFFSDAQRQE